jgi:outer membrane protein OmpA-like peptidoglycan-associated protein
MSLDSAANRSRFARTFALIVLAAGAVLGGCNNNKKAQALQLAQLTDENQTLREENERLNNDYKTASERAAALESENATLKTGGGAGGGGGDRVLTIAGDVAFGPGQISLTAAGKREVDKIIDIIKSQYSSNRIEVAGFTDSDPLKKTKDKYTDNENLSVQRALAVERYMNSQGVSEDQTHSAGYGKSHPKGSKKDSRRVEIRILAN